MDLVFGKNLFVQGLELSEEGSYDLEDCRLVQGRGITKSKYNVSIAAMCFTTNHHLTKKVNVNVDYYIVTKREISCEHDLAKC